MAAMDTLINATTSATSNRRSSQEPQYQYPVQLESLPVDIAAIETEIIQKHVREVGLSWYDNQDILDIDFYFLPRQDFDENPSPLRHVACSTKKQLADVLEVIDPDVDVVLVLINAKPVQKGDKAATKPAIDLSTMLVLCEKFKLLPTFAQMMEQVPGFQIHARDGNMGGPGDPGHLVVDFCYAAPVPWFADDLPQSAILQQTLFTVTNYSRLDHGFPTLTLFSNVPPATADAIKQRWLDTTMQGGHGEPYCLHDHYAFLTNALFKLQDQIRYYEMLQHLHGNLRLELHIKNSTGDMESTIKASRRFTEQITWVQRSLRTLEDILKAFESIPLQGKTEISNRGKQVESKQLSLVRDSKTKFWAENLLRQMKFLQKRIDDIIQKQREDESLAMSYVALRDSRALAHNTGEMTSMARATENSSKKMETMTQEMERDARLMKFLAEVTAIFLPLTAIATFFSMDFWAITDSPPGLVPVFGNAAYSWIYFVMVGVVSLLLFGWLGHKHNKITGKGKLASVDSGKEATDPEEGVDAEESSAAARVSARAVKNRVIAAAVRDQAKKEFDELAAVRPPVEAGEDARREWDVKQGEAVTKLLAAVRCTETGEDVNQMLGLAGVRAE